MKFSRAIERPGRRGSRPAGVIPLFFCCLLAASAAQAADGSSPSPASAETRWYTVRRVTAGDRFEVPSGKVVRYASVVAPDLWSPSKRVENLAKESLEYHRRRIEGKKVRLEWGFRIRDEDGSYLAFVHDADGALLNEEILRAGYAKIHIEPPNVQYAERLKEAARRARALKRGLWRHEMPESGRGRGFVGDKMRREFHYPDCETVDEIPKGHREYFDASVDAVSAGYRWADDCKGKAYEQRTGLF